MFFWMVLGLIVVVSAIVSPIPRNVYRKVAWYAWGAKFLLVCKDLKKPKEVTTVFGTPKSGGKKRTVKVVFIRHGQSVWNSLFNKFGLLWPVRMVTSLITETLCFFTDANHSLIIDSPLSGAGQKEAEGLAKFVRDNKGTDKFPIDPASSMMVSSNLRRAMETAAIGLEARRTATRERILVDSSLQEGSRNIDAQSFSTEKGKIAATPMLGNTTSVMHATVFDPNFNNGNKTTKGNVHLRIEDFVRHVFGLPGSTTNGAAEGYVPPKGKGQESLREVIVVGHSGYFKSFFQRFLPSGSTHVSTKKKMRNCAMVSFELTYDEATGRVSADEATIQALYLGFQK